MNTIEIRQTIPSIHYACGNDELRPVFGFVRFEKDKNGQMVINATDGHIIAQCNADIFLKGEFPECFISAKEFKKLTNKKACYLHFETEKIISIKDINHHVIDYMGIIPKDKFTYPEKQIPNLQKVMEDTGSGEVSSIGFTTFIMQRLLKICGYTIAFGFESESKPIRFESESNGVYGVIMPNMISNKSEWITKEQAK